MKTVTIVTFMSFAMAGCVQKREVNPTARQVEPHYIDKQVENLAKELIDEQRTLANIREAKAKAKSNPTSRNMATPSGAIMAGLETPRTMQCFECDVKIVLEAVATLLGWDPASVYEIGRKPAQGVTTTIDINNEPLMRVLEQIKVDTGHAADIRVDPNFKSILIEYKSLMPSISVE